MLGSNGIFYNSTQGENILKDLKTMAEYHSSESGYVPNTGDIVFFPFTSDGHGHTGLVEKVADGKVHTVEGNTSSKVLRHTYALGSSKLLGYITPNY